MPRGIEVDWVVVRVSPIRRAVVIATVCLVAVVLVLVAYFRLNVPPDVAARRAIDRAEAAHDRARSQPLPEAWVGELQQAASQLNAARTAYSEERWSEAEAEAEGARSRFQALLGAGSHEVVGVGQFFSLEGRVSVQRAGRAEWTSAHQRMPVFNGDFVKSGRDGTAEILFADGSLYRIAPSSLLEIHHESQTDEEPGSVKMVVGRINVYTSGASSKVTTESTETRIERDSRVAVGVDEHDRKTVVEAYHGGAVVRNPRGEEVVIGSRELVAAAADGAFSEKARIPDPPAPLSPQNNTGFDLASQPIIHLRWRNPSERGEVHLQVSRSRRFVGDQIDIDAPALEKEWAKLQAIHAGTYFWRLATVGEQAERSEWSSVQRFRVFSADRQPLLEDRTPPELELESPQQLGQLFIIEGQTEVGARVTINGEGVKMDSEGHFRKAVEVSQEGWNDLIIEAVDPSGNRTERRERVYVEVY